jgi:hypothetical protein
MMDDETSRGILCLDRQRSHTKRTFDHGPDRVRLKPARMTQDRPSSLAPREGFGLIDVANLGNLAEGSDGMLQNGERDSCISSQLGLSGFLSETEQVTTPLTIRRGCSAA